MYAPLVADGDDLTVGQLVALLEGRGLSCSLELLLEVEGDVTQLLLNIPDNFTLGGGGERVTTLHQVLDQEVGQVTTGEIETEDGVRERETFVDGHSVGHTVTGVEHDTSGTTGSVEGEHSLNGDVEGGGVERLEHDLGHLLTVGLRVQGSLSEQDGVLFRCNTELIVEGVMPDLLHVVPVGDDTVLNGVLQSEDTTLRLGLITTESFVMRIERERCTGAVKRHTRHKSPSDPYRPSHPDDGGDRRWICGEIMRTSRSEQ
jgi:hypothetical protein